jgi:type 1 fimbriae regulatory protein FimB/type 1 fimbriae regulatory protein FimE
MNAHLHLVGPRNENRQVGLRRPTNASLRTREFLTPAEIEKLIKSAKNGLYGQRDACLIVTAYRHGSRAKEACELEWRQVEFGRNAALHVRRVKNGKPSVHPIRGDELRMLTALRKEYPNSGYVFTSQHDTPFTPDAINRLVHNYNGDKERLQFIDMTYYALRKDGAYAGVSLWEGYEPGKPHQIAVHDGTRRLEKTASLFTGASQDWPPLTKVAS